MSHLVLARKYRPDTFETVSGQEHVTKTLSNAITRDQVGHAYLFAGPRGVGKTSIARIFAKCLNCATGPTTTPCGKCQNCLEIAQGNSLAVREIDGASHNSVDNVRELIESFRTLPAPGSKYKVYIIDEVHMLSLSAFNALLKSLEEPPPHTVFILATTEPHKIPDTVLSRCQQHDLRALPMKVIVQRLEQIVKDERLSADSQALKMIAKLADGSMRDAQTLLERVRSYTDQTITGSEVSVILGTVHLEALFQLARGIFSQDASAVLQKVEQIFETGTDELVFLKSLVTFFRDLFVVKICSENEAARFDITSDEYLEMSALVEAVDASDVSDLSDMVRSGADKALRSSFPRYTLESLLVKMALRPPVRDMGQMVGRLREMVSASGGAQKKKLVKQVEKQRVPEVEALVSKKLASTGQFSELVKFIKEQKDLILAESLKRVSVEKFSEGRLVLKGAPFVIKSLDYASSKAKLREYVLSFSGWERCEIECVVSQNGHRVEPGSMQHSDEEQLERKREEKKKKILSQEGVQMIKKVFPGSTIESVRLREKSS